MFKQFLQTSSALVLIGISLFSLPCNAMDPDEDAYNRDITVILNRQRVLIEDNNNLKSSLQEADDLINNIVYVLNTIQLNSNYDFREISITDDINATNDGNFLTFKNNKRETCLINAIERHRKRQMVSVQDFPIITMKPTPLTIPQNTVSAPVSAIKMQPVIPNIQEKKVSPSVSTQPIQMNCPNDVSNRPQPTAGRGQLQQPNQNQLQEVITIRKGIPDHRIQYSYQAPCHNLIVQNQQMQEDYDRELHEQAYEQEHPSSNGFFGNHDNVEDPYEFTKGSYNRRAYGNNHIGAEESYSSD